jgi:hypothetical protein
MNISEHQQRVIGLFLLGVATLAVFNIWGPGLLVLIGGSLILDRHGRGSPWHEEPLGLLLVMAGLLLFAHQILDRVAPSFVFPLLLISVSLFVLFYKGPIKS